MANISAAHEAQLSEKKNGSLKLDFQSLLRCSWNISVSVVRLFHSLQPALKTVHFESVAYLRGTHPDNLDAMLLRVLTGVPQR